VDQSIGTHSGLPQPELAGETEESPEVNSDSGVDPEEETELEPELGLSADQTPTAQGDQQDLSGDRTWSRMHLLLLINTLDKLKWGKGCAVSN